MERKGGAHPPRFHRVGTPTLTPPLNNAYEAAQHGGARVFSKKPAEPESVEFVPFWNVPEAKKKELDEAKGGVGKDYLIFDVKQVEVIFKYQSKILGRKTEKAPVQEVKILMSRLEFSDRKAWKDIPAGKFRVLRMEMPAFIGKDESQKVSNEMGKGKLQLLLGSSGGAEEDKDALDEATAAVYKFAQFLRQ